MTWKIVAGTGHRPQHLSPPQRAWLRARLPDAVDYLIAEHGMQIMVSGLALGFDQWWAEAGLDRGVTVWGFAPCPQQADRWTTTDRTRWEQLRARILAAGGQVRFVSDHYHPAVMDDRNEAMLDVADAVVAGYRTVKGSGGTHHAVRSAGRRHLPGVLLDLDHFTHRTRHTRLVGDFADVRRPDRAAA